jgi:hypothetical protein
VEVVELRLLFCAIARYAGTVVVSSPFRDVSAATEMGLRS